jgi:DNA polymerase
MDLRHAESLLAFWADAGVDSLYAEGPCDRTAARPQARVTATAAIGGDPPPAFDLEQARMAAAAAADLNALAAAIAAFEGCGLITQGARQAVCWRGSETAEVMIIGEAPGADEDAAGLPFIGRAGKLLDRMIAAAQLADRVLITNTVFWRPPGNRTPTPEEQQACAPFLERAISLVAPKLILCVGAASARSVLKLTGGILALRGQWREWRAVDGDLAIPALATLHPAFLLRQPSAKKQAWTDFLAVRARLDGLDSYM